MTDTPNICILKLSEVVENKGIIIKKIYKFEDKIVYIEVINVLYEDTFFIKIPDYTSVDLSTSNTDYSIIEMVKYSPKDLDDDYFDTSNTIYDYVFERKDETVDILKQQVERIQKCMKTNGYTVCLQLKEFLFTSNFGLVNTYLLKGLDKSLDNEKLFVIIEFDLFCDELNFICEKIKEIKKSVYESINVFRVKTINTLNEHFDNRVMFKKIESSITRYVNVEKKYTTLIEKLTGEEEKYLRYIHNLKNKLLSGDRVDIAAEHAFLEKKLNDIYNYKDSVIDNLLSVKELHENLILKIDNFVYELYKNIQLIKSIFSKLNTMVGL
jgi:hypothetical protein